MNKKILAILILLGSILSSSFIYGELRDPTRPPANLFMQGTPILLTLSAILIEDNRRIAVLNGLNKKVGDEILGEHITAIEENTVQLEGPSGNITLTLFGEPIKFFRKSACQRDWTICRDVRE